MTSAEARPYWASRHQWVLPLLFLPAVFTIVGVEAPVGASLLFLPVVFTILGVQGVSIFLELLFLTMQTLVGAHCLGP